jgi:phosphohistidine swiveling domain-containing protein
MDRFTRSLEEVGSESLLTVGGKGSNLGELVRAGFPVPRAFCITTEAYRELLSRNSLLAEILTVLDGVDYELPADVERRAARIRELITTAAVPEEITSSIAAGYGRLEEELGPGVPVSVRSSATAEDLPGSSFAGQQDTFLNVSGLDDVVDHTKLCWASLWTDRAIAYRHRQGFRHEDVYLAVIVQEMFPSEVSGVLFTVNPVTSNPHELFLNASWGLGEAVVSGRVDPDQLILDRETLVVKAREIHEKRTMIVRARSGSGSVEVEVPPGRRLVPSLSDEQVAELGTIALRIEDHYGFPQDIEWGWADGRFAVLQSREVTAADIDFSDGLEVWQSPQARASLTDPRWVWSRAYSDEVQTGSTTPLFYTDIQPRMTDLKINAMLFTETPECLDLQPERFREIPYFRWYCARAYYNLAWERERIRLFIPPFARDDAALWPFPVEEREQIRKLPFNWIRFLWTMLKLHVTDPNISLLGTTGYLYERLEGWTDHEQALWEALDLDSASTKEILATREKAREASGFLRNVILPFTIYLFLLPAAMRTALERWCDDDSHTLYNRLSAGLHTKTTEENIAVWALSREIRASDTLMELFAQDDVAAILAGLSGSDDGRAFKASLDQFIKRYGHRGGAERDAIHPRWRHRPELVFYSLRPMVSLGDEEDPQANEDRLHQRMLEGKQQALARAGKGPLGLVRAPFVKWLIGVTQDYIYYRDFERFWNDRTMSRVHDIYLAIARKFIRRDLIVDEQDIFFLGREEILAVEEGQMSERAVAVRVRARRRVYEKYSHREPPKYLRGWQTFDDDRLPDDGRGLRGIPASSGTVTGRARVCRKLEEVSKVGKGDILVTVATDPAWTTVFSIIGGVVVETGGVVAHAVMISREYGIPCVAHLSGACDLIPDGAMITVDGAAGRVVIHNESVEPQAA